MNGRTPSFPVTYAGEVDDHGDVTMPVPWELPREIKVSGIALKNDQPCDGVDHFLTMTLNSHPVVANRKFKGCEAVPPISTSVTDRLFDLQLSMTGFAKSKRTHVSGRAEIFYEDASTRLRIPNSITVPYAVLADSGGAVRIEAAWKLPGEVTVTRVFVQSRALAGNAGKRARLDLAANDGRASEEFDLRGAESAETGPISIRGRRFEMSIVMDGFAKNAEVTGAVLVVFEP